MDDNISLKVAEEREKVCEEKEECQYNVEAMSTKEIDEIIARYNKMRPEGFKYRSEGEVCIRSECKGLEGHISDLEFELEQTRTVEQCDMMINLAYANEMYQRQQDYEDEKNDLNATINAYDCQLKRYRGIEQKYKDCHHEKQRYIKMQKDYEQLMLEYKNLDCQYDKLMLEYDNDKEYFYQEMKRMEHSKRKEEERRCQTRYKSKKGKRN